MSGIAPISGISSVTGLSGRQRAWGRSRAPAPSPGPPRSAAATPSTERPPGRQPPGDSFLNSLSDAFGQLNGQLTSADTAMADFASGGSADLHTVMLQMEEASISLKTATTVRDKLLEAYSEIMRTQL